MSVRPDAPHLVMRYPDCGLCGEETTHNGDSLCCECCHIYWPNADGPGVFRNEDKAHCGATHKPFTWSKHENIRNDTYECLLDEDHDGDHQGFCNKGFEDTWSWPKVESTAGETRDVPTPGGAA